MTSAPWAGDACSLVDAYRKGDHSPIDETEAVLAAIGASRLNAFSHIDPSRARAAAATADITRPFGGVPIGVKELESVAGWPHTGASLVFRDRVATHNSTHVHRILNAGGAVPVGLTTASEFGGLNVSVTKLNGVTHNPWQYGRTVGGSSSGSAAAVAGGLVSLATGGDGGGSIRIPAGYTGMLGMKGTYGRIARGPEAYFRPGTIVLGCLARSVRDAARYYDVCSGPDPRDPSSLPLAGPWEASLGSHGLGGLRVAIVPGLGGVRLEPGVEDALYASARSLIASAGMTEVSVDVRLPNLAAQWMMGNLSTLLAELGDRWPGCAKDLTDEVAIGVRLSRSLYNLDTAARAEAQRLAAIAAMATAFESVDLIIAATNPGPAFPAESTMSSSDNFIDRATGSAPAMMALRAILAIARGVAAAAPTMPNALIDTASSRFPDLVSMGALTIISNIYGNPAVSIPAGHVNGLPVGMQVLAAHHRDALLFDVALEAERTMPWALTAPAT